MTKTTNRIAKAYVESAAVQESELPEALRALGCDMRFQIEASLSNDEVSSDEEIVDFWLDLGIPADAAKAAIVYRSQFFVEPFFRLFDTEAPVPLMS